MSYLLDLIQALEEKEKVSLAGLAASGKEKTVRDFYLQTSPDKINESTLPEFLGISRSHLDKINSILLDKIIKAIWKDDYTTALYSLQRKGLTRLLLHELKIAERNILKEASAKALTRFYKTAFEIMCKLYHPDNRPAITKAYGRKYLLSLGSKKKLADQAWVALSAHNAEMLAQNVAGNENRFREKAWKVIDLWQAKVRQTSNPVVHLLYYYSHSQYIKYYDTDVALFNQLLQKALSVSQKCPLAIQHAYIPKILTEVGLGYIEGNNFEDAYISYIRLYNDKTTITKPPYYTSLLYLASAIATGRLAEAQQIAEEYLEPLLHSGVNRSVQFDVLVNLFTLQLHVGNYSKAFAYVHTLKLFKRNEITPLGQLYLRFCETLYFYKTGEYTLAMAFGKKNLRFFNTLPLNNPQIAYFKHFTLLLLQLVKDRLKNKRPLPSYSDQKLQLYGGLYTIYNTLL